MQLANGQTFAGYSVLQLLGSGGMGEAYRRLHTRLPCKDALKVLALDASPNAEYRARFNREADLASTPEWRREMSEIRSTGTGRDGRGDN